MKTKNMNLEELENLDLELRDAEVLCKNSGMHAASEVLADAADKVEQTIHWVRIGVIVPTEKVKKIAESAESLLVREEDQHEAKLAWIEGGGNLGGDDKG